MAKNRRHQSSKPKRPKIVKSARNREAMKQREDHLAKLKPPKGGREGKIKWKSNGDVEKTIYREDGSSAITTIPASGVGGSTTTWLPLGIINGEFFLTTTAGDVAVCGGTVPFFASTDIIEDASELPLGVCFGDDRTNWLTLYCLKDVPITLTGSCCEFTDTCEVQTTGSFDPSEPGVITAAWPFAYPPEAHEIKISCAGGGSATVLDSSGVAVSPNPIESVSWNPDSISVTVEVSSIVCCSEEFSYKLSADWGSGSAVLVFQGGGWSSNLPGGSSQGTMACPGNTWPAATTSLNCDPMGGEWTFGIEDGNGHFETYRGTVSGLPMVLPDIRFDCDNVVTITAIE